MDSLPVDHAMKKLDMFTNYLFWGSSGTESASIRVREALFLDGLLLFEKFPYAVFFGHPGLLPLYTGDSQWVSMIVTFGLPVTGGFLLANLMVMRRGFSGKDKELKLSSLVIAIFLIFFITNRILDYWPVALLYLLAFSHGCTKLVIPSSGKTLLINRRTFSYG